MEALFSTHFHFILSRSRNQKLDALRRLISSECNFKTSCPILHASFFAGSVTWEIENKIDEAYKGNLTLKGDPPNHLFVPTELHSQVLYWPHSLPPATLVIRGHNLLVITDSGGCLSERYVAACPVCSRNKTSRSPPAGLLHPAPVPQFPWSDIPLDYVTGLRPSNGNTTILTVVDGISKSVHSSPELPSAKNVAELVLIMFSISMT